MTAYREVICSENIAVFVLNVNGWNYVMVFRFDDNALRHTRSLVGLSLIGSTLGNVVETEFTGILADDNGIERIPLTDKVAFLDRVTGLEVERTTIRNVFSK